MARTVMAIVNVISALCTGMDVPLSDHTYRMEDGRIWIVCRRYPSGLDGASEEVLLRCDLTLNQFLDLTEKLSEEDRAGIVGGLVLRAEATDRARSRAA